MNKLSFFLVAFLLTLTCAGAHAQAFSVGRQHSITGLSDPEPAAPRHLVLDTNTKSYTVPESDTPAGPDTGNASQLLAMPIAPAKTLPDTSISLTNP